MSFDDMPDLGPMTLAEGPAYAAWALEKSRAAARTARIVWDVAYGGDFFQKLDLYLPEDRRSTGFPVLVFLHGGAWRHGYKEWNGFMAPNITSLPAIFVAANHRLAPAAKYPAPLDDVIGALAWVHRNIGDYGGDPRRIFLGGHSSGGHLAALATLKRPLLAAASLPDHAIKGCFALSAPLDLRLEKCEPGGRRERVVRNFLLRDDQDRDASVTENVRGNTTPFFLAWGSNDLPELVEHNKHMLELLRNEGSRFEYHVFEGCSHFDTHKNCIDPDNVWIRKVRAWIQQMPA